MSEEPTRAGGATAPSPSRAVSLRWLVPPAVVLVVIVLVRSFLLTPFSIPSGSMEPTLQVGDRILVDLTVQSADLRRGDIIVFDAAASFGLHRDEQGLLGRLGDAVGAVVGHGPDTDYVKRIVGLPGDHVVCCDTAGRVVVNGEPLDEPYLDPGERPGVPYDITVPSGRFWVLGDHRSASSDSRAHLGAPGGGGVRGEDIIGQVRVRYWPLDRAGIIDPSPTSPTARNGQ